MLSTLLTGVAGVLLAPIFLVDTEMGLNLILKAFIAVIIGGFGSVPGAVVGGIMVGLLEILVAVFISSVYKDAIAFAVLIFFLIAFPQGIFGERSRSGPEWMRQAPFPRSRRRDPGDSVHHRLELSAAAGQCRADLRRCSSVSLNIVLGYAGQIALGHAALFGIGAYTAALITAGGSRACCSGRASLRPVW